MSLIQRNVIPILVLLAVIGAGLAVLAVTSPFASGQETDTCEPGVGISIATANAAAKTTAPHDRWRPGCVPSLLLAPCSGALIAPKPSIWPSFRSPTAGTGRNGKPGYTPGFT